MVSFSWRQWLRGTRALIVGDKRRKTNVPRTAHIEGLEERTLLTAPVANPDLLYVVNEDGTLNGSSVLDNDTDADNDIVGAALDLGPTNAASFTFNLDGTFNYTPNPNFNGIDIFTYHAVDATAANSNTTTVMITIGQVNDAGTFGSDTIGIGNEDNAITGTLTFTDTADGATTPGFTVTGAASNGTATIGLVSGNWIYTPNLNFHGTDHFTVSVTDDDGNVETQVIAVTVNAVNDAPVANTANFSTTEDTQHNGALTGSDVDGDGITFALDTPASHGTATVNPNGTFSYLPNANYHGSDTFTFVVNDGTVASAPAVVTVTVDAVVDLIANGDTFITNEDTPLSNSLATNDSTTSGGTLAYALGTQASNGAAVVNSNGTFTYTPNANFNGSDNFSYTVTDANAGEAATRTVSITINAVADLTATNDSFATDEDAPLSNSVATNDSTTSGGTLVYSLAGQGSHGTAAVNANGTFTYTPTANFHGSDSFTYTVVDTNANEQATRTVSITVNAINDTPIANTTNVSTSEDTPVIGTLTGSDVDGDTLTFSAGSVNPGHGGVVISPDGGFTYTPAANFHGTDTFSFKVNDGTANSAEATVNVSISSVNDAPTVSNGSATVAEDAVLNGSVSSLGVDVDGDTLTYVVVTAPAHGGLVLSPDGTFVYTPNGNYNGPDSFTFRANDGTADSGLGTVNITVTPVEDPLVLTLPSGPIQVIRDSIARPLDEAATVSDPDTVVNYANAEIHADVIAGGTPSDDSNGRVTLKVRNQGTGTGLVRVSGTKLYYNGSAIAVARFSGGRSGRPLVIQFTSSATETVVNAVLKQVSIQASKKASLGNRTVGVEVVAGGQIAQATKIATVV